jgi:hypothetical protein
MKPCHIIESLSSTHTICGTHLDAIDVSEDEYYFLSKLNGKYYKVSCINCRKKMTQLKEDVDIIPGVVAYEHQRPNHSSRVNVSASIPTEYTKAVNQLCSVVGSLNWSSFPQKEVKSLQAALWAIKRVEKECK